jgi:membrane glycosyltransferase
LLKKSRQRRFQQNLTIPATLFLFIIIRITGTTWLYEYPMFVLTVPAFFSVMFVLTLAKHIRDLAGIKKEPLLTLND